MANQKNIEPHKIRSAKEAREKGRKGGKKSGEVRRRKKAVREVIEMIASQPVTNEGLKKSVRAVASGIDPEEIDMITAATMGLFKSAMKGNEKAFKVIAEYYDEAAIGDESEEDALSASLRELGESL